MGGGGNSDLLINSQSSSGSVSWSVTLTSISPVVQGFVLFFPCLLLPPPQVAFSVYVLEARIPVDCSSPIW